MFLESTQLPIDRHMIHNTILPMIEDGTAERIIDACFRDGIEDEFIVEFYYLWGRVIRSCHNRRTTGTDYTFVSEGWQLEKLKGMRRNFVGAGI